MKPYKILLSLHSIKLIVISALALIFLAITATNSSNKIEAIQGDVSIANEEPISLTVVNSGTKRTSNK